MFVCRDTLALFQAFRILFRQPLIIFAGRYPASGLFFEVAARVSGDFAATVRGVAIFVHALRIDIARDFRRRCFAEFGKQQLERGHMVAQIFVFQTFQALVFARRHAEGCAADIGGQDCVIAL